MIIFKRFSRLQPIRNRVAITAKWLADYVLEFGLPLKLLSNQNPSYENDLFKELLINLGIKKLEPVVTDPKQMG